MAEEDHAAAQVQVAELQVGAQFRQQKHEELRQDKAMAHEKEMAKLHHKNAVSQQNNEFQNTQQLQKQKFELEDARLKTIHNQKKDEFAQRAAFTEKMQGKDQDHQFRMQQSSHEHQQKLGDVASGTAKTLAVCLLAGQGLDTVGQIGSAMATGNNNPMGGMGGGGRPAISGSGIGGVGGLGGLAALAAGGAGGTCFSSSSATPKASLPLTAPLALPGSPIEDDAADAAEDSKNIEKRGKDRLEYIKKSAKLQAVMDRATAAADRAASRSAASSSVPSGSKIYEVDSDENSGDE